MKPTLEKIIKRDNGTRIKIIVTIRDKFFRVGDVEYQTLVMTCEKGKRTWNPTYNNDDYRYRVLNMDERRRFEYKSQFKFVTKEELHSAKVELWKSLKPELESC